MPRIAQGCPSLLLSLQQVQLHYAAYYCPPAPAPLLRLPGPLLAWRQFEGFNRAFRHVRLKNTYLSLAVEYLSLVVAYLSLVSRISQPSTRISQPAE